VDLSEIVKEFAGAAKRDPNLIVGFETSDDAGVYRLTDDLALVQTVDYITPVVDDPYLFGQVAAANSLSDVYAMGGRPLTVMNLCNFPGRGIDKSDLRKILEGAFNKVQEAGATLVGGHTVRDDDLKFGLSVTGLIDPKRVLTNTGARPGDALVLTKPVGTGVLIQGHRRGMISDEILLKAVHWMAALNKESCEAMLEFEPHACTDVTGFGFAGHAVEIAKGSNVRLRVRFDDLPKYDESLELIGQGVTTAVTASNLQVVRGKLTFSGTFTEEETGLVVDPQTSGGLLISLPRDQAPTLVRRLRDQGNPAAAVIGEVLESGGNPGLEIIR
jgi:selenide,water dikinase